MSPRSSKQYEEIRESRKRQIMDIAIEVFAEKTFQGATISMIAKRANISKGLMYNYFASKDELLKEIIRDATQKVWKNFDSNSDGVLTEDEFYFFIKESLRVVKENISYWKLYSTLVLQPTVLKIIEHDFDEVAAHYGKLIYAFFAQYKVEDIEGEMLLFSSMLKGAIIQYIGSPLLFPIDKFENKMIDYYNNLLTLK